MLERPKPPARAGRELGRLVLGRLTEPDRDEPALVRLTDDLEDDAEDGRATLLVRLGFGRGRLTIALLGRAPADVRVMVGRAPARPTVPVRVVDVGGRPTTFVLDVVGRARPTVSTRLTDGRPRLTPVVRVAGTPPTTEVRVGERVVTPRSTGRVRVGVRLTVPVRVGLPPTRPTGEVRRFVTGGRRSTVGVRPPPYPGRGMTPRRETEVG